MYNSSIIKQKKYICQIMKKWKKTMDLNMTGETKRSVVKNDNNWGFLFDWIKMPYELYFTVGPSPDHET